jgi:DNA-directed RNA polymerase specialized sigma24 family protein
MDVFRAQLDGVETADIAIQNDISIKTVYSRVSRAKQQLRDCVEQKLK